MCKLKDSHRHGIQAFVSVLLQEKRNSVLTKYVVHNGANVAYRQYLRCRCYLLTTRAAWALPTNIIYVNVVLETSSQTLSPPSGRGTSVVLFLSTTAITKFQGNILSRCIKCILGKNLRFHPKSLSIWETVREARGYYGSLVRSHKLLIDLCWFQWPWVTWTGGMRVAIFFWWISVRMLIWFDLKWTNLTQ